MTHPQKQFYCDRIMSQTELKHQLAHLSYSEKLYVAIQMNSIDAVNKLLIHRYVTPYTNYKQKRSKEAN